MSVTPGWWQVVDGRLVSLDTGVSFPYPDVPPPPPTTYSLVYSTSGNRSNPLPLAGATITGPVAVFVAPEVNAASVTFSIDNVLGVTESTAPFDLLGATGSTANLWSPTAGAHTVAAVVSRADGTTQTITASVTSTIGAGSGGGGGTTGDMLDPDGNVIVWPTGWPVEESLAATGPRYALTPSGSVTTTEDGQVIERLDITGILTIRHRNVIVRDCKVRSGSNSFGINIAARDASNNAIRGIVIEHTAVEMVNSSGGNGCIGGLTNTDPETAYGDKIIVRYCRFTGYADGIKASDWGLYHHNVIRVRRAPGTTKHVDGIQASGRSHFEVRDNWIEQDYSGGHNAAVFWQPYTGAANVYITDIVVHDNVVNGGVNTIQSGQWKSNVATPGAGPAMTDCQVYDNVFFRDYLYGVFVVRGGEITGGPGVRGGVWFDTLEQVPVGTI